MSSPFHILILLLVVAAVIGVCSLIGWFVAKLCSDADARRWARMRGERPL